MRRVVPLAAALLLLAAGCVSKKDFVAKSDEATRLAADLGRERARSGELAIRAAQLEGQLEEVQRTLAATTEERDRIRGELVTARGEAARLAGQLAEASDQRDTLARQLAIVQQSASDKDVNLQRLTYRYDDLIKDLERQKTDLSRRTTDLTTQLARANSRIDGLVAERDALQGDRLRLDARARDLAIDLATAQQALETSRRDLDASRQELAAARQSLGETQAQLAERERKLKETTATYDKLVGDLKGEIAEGQVKITRLRDRLTLNLVDKILFDSGSIAIKPRGQEVLRKVARVLKGVTDKRIQIEGHTDNVRIAGSLQGRFPSNWELSVARATVVARFLQDQGGLDPARLVATGYGEYRPVAANDTPEGRAQNRRIEIVLVPDTVDTALK